MITVGDLFAGIGGVALGMKNAGFKIEWANEFDAKACSTYKENFKHKLYECDIKELNPATLKKVDMITGGFPCQAFSIAGHRKGFEDARGTLFFEIMRLVDYIKPNYLFFENVKNLEKHDSGNTFNVILSELKKRKYHVKYQVLNTCEYSQIPQNRERIYIVAFKDKKVCDNFNFPKKVKRTKTIKDIIEKTADDLFYYNKTKYYKQLKEQMTNPDTVYQWRRVYLRENKANLCPTLTANMGMGGHNVPLILDTKGIRKLTPRECARFQGFPETFSFPDGIANSALYKQFGNSVSVPVIESIGKEIIKAIKKG